ncbi:eukaryotic translation initiation factor 4 gamma 3 isoform X2 [Patella vulgata]|uniref:eukaryotic translation initiation factor 4 gamma 3 isoform X2 n=1 Tax=Patella vulgata TaxID=6465 RepID=UPI00217F406F|nr:eukaryotic translation initiation factor 4 gamma 3 isoform X2 [Patella vulgata]
MSGRPGSSQMIENRNSQQGPGNDGPRKIIGLHEAENAWPPGRKVEAVRSDVTVARTQTQPREVYRRPREMERRPPLKPREMERRPPLKPRNMEHRPPLKPPGLPQLDQDGLKVKWEQFEQEFDQYLEDYGLEATDDAIKCALLRQCIGKENMYVYDSFYFEKEDDRYILHELKKKFSTYCKRRMGGDGVQKVDENRSEDARQKLPNRGGQQRNNQYYDDGWNTTASKPLRNIDLSKMKITKTTVDENIQLGPGGGSSRFGVWGRESSGGRHIGSLVTALPEKNITGRTTPSSSNPASRESSRSREPRMDKPEAAPVPGILSEDEMEKKTKTIIDEYLHINNLKEALMCVSEINNPATVHLFIEFSINHVLERSSIARQQTGHLHHELVSKKIISVDSYLKGLNKTLQKAENMEMDIPKIWLYLGELIGPMIQDGSVPLNFLKQACEPLQASGKSGVVVAAVLHDASRGLGYKKVASLWKSSALQWTDFVAAENVTEFLADKELEFTVAADSPVDKVSFETIQEQLLVRLRDVNFDNEHMFDLIEANIPDESTKNPKFIRTLMIAVCKSAVSEGPNYKVNENVIKQRQSLLVKYLDSQQEFEIQALYALQAFVNELQHPEGVLRTFFETLYDEDIISEDAFNQWSNSNDPAEQEGKGVAMKQVFNFFAWLKEGEQDES